ncbi:MAG: ATP-binding cassette domain-containing protein, partial [Ruthenibacterium sp.]
MSETRKIIVEGKELSKEFNGNIVLKNVSICCEEGSAIALVGENGAGKSTLMNIISGGLCASSGTVLVDGAPVKFTNSQQAKAVGIAFVHQELSLMNEMTVGENIMLGREPQKGCFIDQKKLHEQAGEVLREIGYHLDITAIVADLAPSDRQITEIAKAWAGRPRMMIFDEPTSSLNKNESKILFRFIARIKKSGVAVIMISHRMEDIFATCDVALVLKDGELVFHVPVSETNEDELISKM